MTNNRVLGFDFLRGLCAIGVAYYHILGSLGVNDIKLYSVGLYGVYIFFILSGASIYIAYADKIRAGYDLRKFLGQRLFRLAPLFALVVLVGPLFDYNDFQEYGRAFLDKAILNVTFAFGLGNPGHASLATGGWSLGIEFVFYLLFPVILAFVSGSIRSALVFLAAAFLVQTLFVRTQINGYGDLGRNYYTYLEFLAFPAYFVAGCIIGRTVMSAKVNVGSIRWQTGLWVAFVLLALTVLLSNGSYREVPLIGVHRLLLPLACATLVLAAGFVRFPSRLTVVATALGNMSYGLYLLHPLVFGALNQEFKGARSNPIMLGTLFILCAAILALVIEHVFERPINNFGKRVLSKKPSLSNEAITLLRNQSTRLP